MPSSRPKTNEGARLIKIRPYEGQDVNTTRLIFDSAVTVTASADYTLEQVEAWRARRPRTLSQWDQSMRSRDSYVALIGERVVGFSDLGDDGHIHMLFVDPRFARRGVGGALLTFLEAQAKGRGLTRLSANVSITARPLFESRGFKVHREQEVRLARQKLTNFRMTKKTASPSY